MKLAFDIGMFDGNDTRYLLDEGFRVVAVEANPALAAAATHRFRDEIADQRLTVVNRAISDQPGEVELVLCDDDYGASTIIPAKIAHRHAGASCKVAAIGLNELIHDYGLPDYLKVDIEGADRHCILAITADTRPGFVSFEADEDVAELIEHLMSVGYSRFKLIGQCTFTELGREQSFAFRLRRRLMRSLGFDEPTRIRQSGRWFTSMHSTGPGPWASDGSWYDGARLMKKLRDATARGRLTGWYDVHVRA